MKFLVDENLGASVSKWLRKQGYDVICIGTDFAGISDQMILKKASVENRILITCDTDFGQLVFKDMQVHKGIVLIRNSNLNFEKILQILINVLNNHSNELANNFVVVADNGTRIIEPMLH